MKGEDMYESPINQILGELQMHLEGETLKAVQNVGIDVDKEELIKALQYDRNQYSKGYADAIDEFAEEMKWEYRESIGTSEREIHFALAVIDQVAERLKGVQE